MGENQKKKFLSIFGIRMTQFAKKKEKFFLNFLTQKNSITPRWGDPQWAKIKKKIFFIFGIRMTQFAKKSKKKILTQNLVLECVECDPKRGQNDLLGRRVIHR